MSSTTTNSSTTNSSKLHPVQLPALRIESQPMRGGEDRLNELQAIELQAIELQAIELQAIELLAKHPHFRGRSHFVDVRCRNNCLCLSGRLPNYYLKQLAQEAVRGLQPTIQNQITVSSPDEFHPELKSTAPCDDDHQVLNWKPK